MGMIGINRVVFLGTMSEMTTIGNAINGTIKTWASEGEKSMTFAKYVENYSMLQGILSEYKELVLKDIKQIDKVGGEIIKTDDALLHCWR